MWACGKNGRQPKTAFHRPYPGDLQISRQLDEVRRPCGQSPVTACPNGDGAASAEGSRLKKAQGEDTMRITRRNMLATVGSLALSAAAGPAFAAMGPNDKFDLVI